MKNFILKYIWAIRMIWIAVMIVAIAFVDSWPLDAWIARVATGAIFLILGTFVFFPQKILGEPRNTNNKAAKTDSVNVNDTNRHKEEWYAFPDPTASDITIREKVFTDIDQVKRVYNQTVETAKKTKKESLVNILNPFMLQLKVRIPKHLYEKVNQVFMFTQADMDTHYKHNLQEIFLERMNASIGMYILNKLFLTENELQELNQAWHPFIFIHPTMHYIVISKSEAAQIRSKKQLEELGLAQKELQV